MQDDPGRVDDLAQGALREAGDPFRDRGRQLGERRRGLAVVEDRRAGLIDHVAGDGDGERSRPGSGGRQALDRRQPAKLIGRFFGDRSSVPSP